MKRVLPRHRSPGRSRRGRFVPFPRAPAAVGWRRLTFEPLEARRMLAVLMVNSAADNDIQGDGLVTLLEASVETGEVQGTASSKPVLTAPGTQDIAQSNAVAMNLPPVLVVADDQIAFEGQLLDLTGMHAPLLGLFIDSDQGDTHLAAVDWNDGTSIDPLDTTTFRVGGSVALSGSHTYLNAGKYHVTVRVADDKMSGDFVNGVAGKDFVERSFMVTVKAPLVIDLNGDAPGEDAVFYALRGSVVQIGSAGQTVVRGADSILLQQAVIEVELAGGVAPGTVTVDLVAAGLRGIRVTGQGTGSLMLEAEAGGATLADFQAVLQTLRFIGGTNGPTVNAAQAIVKVTVFDIEGPSGSARAIIQFITVPLDGLVPPPTEDGALVEPGVGIGAGPPEVVPVAATRTVALPDGGTGSGGGLPDREERFESPDRLLAAERALQRALTSPQSARREDVIDVVFSLGDLELVSLLGIDMGDEPVHVEAKKEQVNNQVADVPAPPRTVPESIATPPAVVDDSWFALWGAIAGSGMLWLGGTWWWMDRMRRRRLHSKGL